MKEKDALVAENCVLSDAWERFQALSLSQIQVSVRIFLTLLFQSQFSLFYTIIIIAHYQVSFYADEYFEKLPNVSSGLKYCLARK